MRSRSALIIVLLAAVLNVGTTGGLLYLRGDKFNASVGLLEDKPLPITLWSFKSASVDGLIRDLKKQKDELDARQVDLGKIEARIESERTELEKVRSDVEAIRDEISQRIPRIEESEAKNIKDLAKTYTSVKPTAAVAIFKEMSDDTVVKILSSMKAETAGAILAEMSKTQDKDESMAKRAARISDKLRLLEPLKKAAPQT